MAKKFIAANWKMNGSSKEGTSLVAAISSGYKSANAEVLICPPFTIIHSLTSEIKKAGFFLGAQDCHYEEKGAFTGDVSSIMLREAGCNYVIIGHSERRQYHGETSQIISRKAVAVTAHGITPIICVGESLEDRASGRHIEIVGKQLAESVPDIKDIIIAYEPIWAIGTGKVAGLGEITEMHGFLKEKLKQGFSNRSFRVIYGGSVGEANAKEILASDLVDGALVGSASLQADSFLKILNSV